jgi:hypothetical protein
MHGHRHQQVATLQLKVASFLTDSVKAEVLQSHNEPFGSDRSEFVRD